MTNHIGTAGTFRNAQRERHMHEPKVLGDLGTLLISCAVVTLCQNGRDGPPSECTTLSIFKFGEQ